MENTNFINFDSLIWHSDDEPSDNSSAIVTCRNSVQGKSLVVDDRGKLIFLIVVKYHGEQ